MKILWLLAAVSLLVSTAFAQDSPRLEASLNYSYMRFNPENSNVINSFSLNGGGGAFSYFFNSMVGIKAEVEGYGSQTRHFNFTNTAFCKTEGGVCTGSAQANLFTYNVGPVGPWLPASAIPEHAREIECSQINANPKRPVPALRAAMAPLDLPKQGCSASQNVLSTIQA